MSHELVPKGKTEDDEFESRDYQDLEQEFQAVLKEIGGDKQLEHFRREYEKLHRALKSSHENEKKLIKKCKELNNNITESTIKVQQALRLSQEENDNIRAFQNDLDRAVKTLEAFKEKEDKAKKTIQSLREEIEHLGQIVEQGSGLAVGQDSTVNELIRAKEELTREVEIANEHIQASQQEQGAILDRTLVVEHASETCKQDIEGYKALILELKEKMNAEVVLKQQIENNLNEEKSKFEGIIDNIQKKEREIQEIIDSKQEVQRELHREDDDRQEKTISLQQADKDKKNNQNEKFDKEAIGESIIRAIGKLDEDIDKHREDSMVLSEEQDKLKSELHTLNKKHDKLVRERKEAEQLRNQSKECMQSLIRESEELRKGTEADKKVIENLKRERDMVMRSVRRAKDNIRTQEEAGIMMENSKKKLDNELKKYTKDIKKLKDKVYQLQKEQERYGIEKSQAYAKYSQCLEEVKLCNSVISELQTKNGEVEKRLKQHQSLYEAVCSDRNLYCKNLQDSKEEIAELEKKKTIMKHQIKQLKEEKATKNKAIYTEQQNLSVLENKKNESEIARDKLQKEKEKLEKSTKKSEKDIQRLKYVISEVEQEKAKQKKELELVTNERNILSTQLIRRKAELDLLYEKIKIYSSTLEKGEEQYKKRESNIEDLKGEIAALKSHLSSDKEKAMKVFDLNKQKYYVEKEVLEEKIKVKALSEEVENTMNIHRWRKLEGTDPESYELITKIQTLQRRLISKTGEVVDKAKDLEELESDYNKLKTTLSRHPGPESQDKIQECQKLLEEKHAQMKNMEQELGLYQAQADQYKFEIERLNRELHDVKKNYFEIKKRDQIKREAQLRLEGKDKPTIQRNPPPQRFTGGGFNLAI